jgi:hypothetical protein
MAIAAASQPAFVLRQNFVLIRKGARVTSRVAHTKAFLPRQKYRALKIEGSVFTLRAL